MYMYMYICIKQKKTSLISIYASTTLLLQEKHNILNKIILLKNDTKRLGRYFCDRSPKQVMHTLFENVH